MSRFLNPTKVMATIDDNLRKVPPQNLEAESSVLGGVLLDNEAINVVLETLRASSLGEHVRYVAAASSFLFRLG